jgi:hypothetical protein
MRANPASLCTKWVAESDEMPDELHALEDAISAAVRARDKWLHEHPAVRVRLARLRDSSPPMINNEPFSLFKAS